MKVQNNQINLRIGDKLLNEIKTANISFNKATDLNISESEFIRYLLSVGLKNLNRIEEDDPNFEYLNKELNTTYSKTNEFRTFEILNILKKFNHRANKRQIRSIMVNKMHWNIKRKKDAFYYQRPEF